MRAEAREIDEIVEEKVSKQRERRDRERETERGERGEGERQKVNFKVSLCMKR